LTQSFSAIGHLRRPLYPIPRFAALKYLENFIDSKGPLC
jgi:hypothetical protein